MQKHRRDALGQATDTTERRRGKIRCGGESVPRMAEKGVQKPVSYCYREVMMLTCWCGGASGSGTRRNGRD